MTAAQPTPRRSRRGGPRPGAGAPKGNLNALKHGRRSAQFAQIGALLASIPQARTALLTLARRHGLKQRRAEEVAAVLLQRLLEHAHQIQNARLNVQSAIVDRRTIKKSDPNTRRAGYAAGPKTKIPPPVDQTPNLAAPAPSNPRYEKPLDRMCRCCPSGPLREDQPAAAPPRLALLGLRRRPSRARPPHV